MNVTTLNQFGSQRFDVKKPTKLMVPTEKTENVKGTPVPITTPIDHYQCYKVKPDTGIRSLAGKPKKVTLSDQFDDGRARVKKAKELCAPVDKNGEGVRHQVDHLLCYKIKADRFRQRAKIENQFETKKVAVKKPVSVCLPTDKIVTA